MHVMFTLMGDVSPIRPHNSATGCAPMPLSLKSASCEFFKFGAFKSIGPVKD